jgi:hypothetical protein
LTAWRNASACAVSKRWDSPAAFITVVKRVELETFACAAAESAQLEGTPTIVTTERAACRAFQLSIAASPELEIVFGAAVLSSLSSFPSSLIGPKWMWIATLTPDDLSKSPLSSSVRGVSLLRHSAQTFPSTSTRVGI